MNRLKALLMKFIITLAAAWIAFSLFGNTLLSVVLVIAVSSTVINYLIGDLMVLPFFGNIIAAIGDGLLAAVTAYIITVNSYGYVISSIPFIIFAALIFGSEYYFHKYLLKRKELLPNVKEMVEGNKPNFNFETSVEFDLNDRVDKEINNDEK